MYNKLNFFFILFFFSHYSIVYACSCLSIPATFCSIANSEHTFLTGKVIRHYEKISPNDFPVYTFIDILVTERIHGEDIQNMITILGKDGTSCEINLEQYADDTHWVFKLSKKNSTDLNVGLEFPLYRMSPCNINTLPIENGFIVGLIAPGEHKMTVKEFKDNLDQCFLIVDTKYRSNSLHFDIQPNVVTTGVEILKGITHLEVKNQSTQLRIISANGQLVEEREIPEEEMLFWIDMSSYGSGVYFLVFYTKEDVFTKKIVKI